MSPFPAGTALAPERWRQARRLLLVRLDNLGDVILMTPAFRAIKETCPHIALTLLASPTGAAVAPLVPELDDVIVYPAPWTDLTGDRPPDPSVELATLERLRAGRFDGAIIFTSYHQSPLPAALLAYLAGIPLRHAASVDFPGRLLTSRHRHPDRRLHEVERALDLVGALGFGTSDPAIRLRVPPAERAWAEARWPPGRPRIIVHPGCTAPARAYPPALYAQVVARLTAQGAAVIVTGGPAERALATQVAGPTALSLAGQTTLPQLAGLIATADLVLTNNTGPMHLAAGLQTPVVALFAQTNDPAQWGPWRVPHRLLYRPVDCALCRFFRCPYDNACLAAVSPETVVATVWDLLKTARRERP